MHILNKIKMSCLMLPFYYNIKTSNKQFLPLDPEKPASSYSISAGKYF